MSALRLMVTGSRNWRDMRTIRQALARIEWENPHAESFSLINGCASGADAIARAYAVHLGWEPEDYWPDYANYDFAEANKLRNMEMVDSEPTCIYAFPTKNSRGTWHAVNYAKSQGYVLGDTLFIFNEQKEVRQTKDINEFGPAA